MEPQPEVPNARPAAEDPPANPAPGIGSNNVSLEAEGPSLEEASFADDFTAGTDAPLGRAGVARALAND